MRKDGSGLRAVSVAGLGSANVCCGHWSPDGRYFFFVKQEGTGADLWAIREPTGFLRWRASAPVKLTTGPLIVGGWTISPDGKKMFVSASQGRAELVRYEPTSKQFVSFLEGISAGELDYSRDGHWVTYITYPDQTLWRSRADGSDRLQLTYPPAVAGLPRWSPDGAQIAYIATQPGQPWSLFVIPAQGGAAERLLNDSSSQADPSWSPDGKRLAYGRLADPNGGIFVLDLGSRQVSMIPGSERKFSGRWSPDGRYLAALDTDSTKLFLYDFQTQAWSEWAMEQGAFGFPNWSRDGKYLYYDIAFVKDQTLRRVRVGEHKSELVADLKDLLRYAIPPAFGWSGIAPDGSALVDRDLSTDEIYALDLVLP